MASATLISKENIRGIYGSAGASPSRDGEDNAATSRAAAKRSQQPRLLRATFRQRLTCGGFTDLLYGSLWKRQGIRKKSVAKALASGVRPHANQLKTSTT